MYWFLATSVAGWQKDQWGLSGQSALLASWLFLYPSRVCVWPPTCADAFLHVCVAWTCQHGHIKDTWLFFFFFSIAPLKSGDIFSYGWAAVMGWWHSDWSHGNGNWAIFVLHNENWTLTSALKVWTNLERQENKSCLHQSWGTVSNVGLFLLLICHGKDTLMTAQSVGHPR